MIMIAKLFMLFLSLFVSPPRAGVSERVERLIPSLFLVATLLPSTVCHFLQLFRIARPLYQGL